MRFIIAMLLIGWGSSSWAFNFNNHRVICQMAYEQLTPATRLQVDALIKKSPFNNFAEACPWPDSIRNQAEFRHTKAWHYVNVPRSVTEVKVEHCPAQGCLLSAINNMQQRIASNPNNDWQALLFLSHFIGDLHQPLHVSFADDYGGNNHKVTLRKRSTNLHTLWDGEMLKRQPWPVVSERLFGEITIEQHQQWRQGDIYRWATESLNLTHDAYRLLPPSNKASDKYLQFFAPKLEQQLQKASVRLAMLLERSYASSEQKP